MNETLPSGKYFIGDPLDVLHTKIYIGIWGNVYNYENGKFNIFGHDIIFHTTHSGDGFFKDSRDRTYKIDSGVIGIINLELIEDNLKCKNGHIFEFNNNVNFIYDAGQIYIKSGKKYININTRNEDEYDSEYEEHCLNDYGEPISKTICGDSDDDYIEEEDFDLESDDEKEEYKTIEKNESFQFFKKK
jgi:hypothetical protein